MSKTIGFQFVDYIVRKSVFLNKPQEIAQEDIEIEIVPNGIINIEEGQFQLLLAVNIALKDTKPFINVEFIGLFEFNGELESIKPMMCLNAPAILFPYVRAYVNSLTALSGINAITLPTMNLTYLKDKLEERLKVIESE